jgi:ligand-binding SRPBCC domain-containing protein
MQKVESSIVIQRPVEVVFAYVCDFSNVPRWDPTKSELRVTPEGPVGLGTTVHMVTSFQSLGLNLKLASTMEVTAYEANRKYTMTATSGPFPFEFYFLVEPAEGGAWLTMGVQAEVGGFYKFVEGVLVSRVKKEQVEQVGRLKGLLEAVPVS